MPAVPVYRPDSVQHAGLTGARLQTTQQSDGGVSQALRGAGQDLQAFALMEEKRLIDIDEATVRSLNNEFAERERAILWGNPEAPGVMALEGRAAVTAAQQAREEIESLRGEITGRAQGKRQADMLAKSLDARLASTRDAMARQEITQTQAWNKTEATALIVNRGQDASRAYGTPEFNSLVTALFVAVEDRAGLSGEASAENLKAAKREAFTALSRDVVGSLLDTDPGEAVKFVETYGDMIEDGARGQLLDAAKRADVNASVMSEADAIWSASGGDYGKAMGLAAAQKDLTKRAALENRIDQLRSRSDRVEADQKGALWERLAPIIQGGKSFSELSATDQQAAAVAGITNNLMALEKDRTEAGQAQPNGPTINMLRVEAINNPARFRAIDLIGGIDPLSGKPWSSLMRPDEFATMLAIQKGARDEVGASLAPAITATRGMAKPVFDQTFGSLKPDERRPLEAQLDGYITGALMQRVSNQNAPLTPADYDAIAKGAFLPTGDKDAPFYFQTRAAKLQIEEPASWGRVRSVLVAINGGKDVTIDVLERAVTRGEAGGVIVPFGQIAPADRTRLIADWKRRNPGKKPMERDIERHYTRALMGDLTQ